MINWDIINPQLLSLMMQLKAMQAAMMQNPPEIQSQDFMIALSSYIDLIGQEIEKQGQ